MYEYIAYVLQSPQTAIGQLDRLEHRIIGLEHLLERYWPYESPFT